MKIKQKLILGFAGIASLVGVVGYISTYVSQRALQNSIGENAVVLAIETMDTIDRELYHIIEEFQAYCKDSILQQAIIESNQEFEKLQNIQNYIDNIDSEWTSLQTVDTTSLLYRLINNEVSEDLNDKIEFHNQNRGYKVLGEIIVTNKYGANIALTGKTSDYRQDDEQWWQKAKEQSLYIYGTEFDESAGIYSTVIAVRIDDEKGNFAGALKVVTNISQTINIIKQTKNSKYRTAEIKLFSINGELIHDTSNEFKFLEDISNKSFFNKIKGFSGYFLKKAEQEELREGRTELIAYARSQGFKNNNSLNWILAIEYQTNDLFASVITLRNIIIGASFALTTLAIIIGLLISDCISKPISELRSAIDKIDKGNLDVHIDVKNNNELGQLVAAFNRMTQHRKLVSVALQKVRDELDERVHQRTTELAEVNISLKSEISRHKETEQALRDSEQRLNAILNSILAGVVVIDAKTHKIIDANPLAVELIGIPKHNIIGKACQDFIRPIELGKDHERNQEQVLDQAECVLLATNNKEIPIFKSVAFTTWQGHKYLIESFVDITSRKKAEEEMEKLNSDLESANKELIRTNKELQEFTNVAAHDLKTPLRAIGVLANWILTDYADKFDKKGRDQVKLLIGRTERMNRLIDGLLEYSNAGQSSQKQNVDLNTVLSKVTSEIVPPNNTKIIVENQLPTIFCDKTRVTRVFWHIINNAVRYSDKSERLIKIGCVQEDEFWTFSIADNGPGIDQKYFEKIFKMCQKLSPHDLVGGTGIGLSIAKKIIEDDGGKIWLESEIGQGSTFYFTLPCTSCLVTC